MATKSVTENKNFYGHPNFLEKEFDLSERIFQKGTFNKKPQFVINIEDVKEFIRKLKEGIELIYEINKENAIKSGVSLKLRNEVLDLLSGSLDEVKNIVNKLAGEKLIK